MKHPTILLLLVLVVSLVIGSCASRKQTYASKGQTYWERRHRYDYKQKRYYYPSHDRDNRARWQSRK
jgi:hypothetical protein